MRIGRSDERYGMKNQKGVSIIELIAVIAILSVLTGVTVFSVGTLSSWRLTKCTKGLETGLALTRAASLSHNRLDTAHTENAGLKISNEAGRIVLRVYGEPEQVVGDRSISLTYLTKEGTQEHQKALANGETLTISFDRSSGAFLPVDTNGSEDIYCTGLLLERRGKTRTIVLVPVTGKFYIQDAEP